MTDILDELQEANKEERTQKILNSLLKIVGILAFLSIAITALVSWYAEQQKNKIYATASDLTAILRKINTPTANNAELTQDMEKISDHSSSSYGALSNFYLAAISNANANLNKMAYFYDKVATNNEYDSNIREHASINSNSIKLQNKSISSEQAIAHLDKILTDNRNTPFFTAITLLKASILAENNDFANASKELNLAITSSKNDDGLSKMLQGMSIYVNSKFNDKEALNKDNIVK